MPFKRRHAYKTDYKKRLKMLKSKLPRLVVRRSLKYITAQIAEYENKSDKIRVAATSRELKKLGWEFACDNLPAGYLTGLLIGKKSLSKNITQAVLNGGLYPSVKGSRIYAVAKGAIDAGLKVPVDSGVMPSDDRIKGGHISHNEKFKKMPEEFERVKQRILGG